MNSADRDVEQVRQRLVDSARTASTGEENLLSSAEQLLRALANLPDVRYRTDVCNNALRQAMMGLIFFTNIARIDRTGTIVCSADRDALGLSVAGRPIWRTIETGNEFKVSERMTSQLNGAKVIVGMLPLRDSNGAFIGAVAIGIDVRWLDFFIAQKHLPPDTVMAIFDRNGTVIAANRPDVAASVFGRPRPAEANDETIHSATDDRGRRWTYATAKLLRNSVLVGFAMRESRLFTPTYVHVTTDFLLPILMIVFAWGAIWIATDRQITRWIVYLRRVALAYSSGHYAIRPALENAPSEFKRLGETMADMAQSIEDRDKRLREAVEQKTLLIREIHHRVKNNLQIVMSLLSLQALRLKDVAAQDALKRARMRINALALIHRVLHEIEDQTTVDLKLLLEDLALQTFEGLSGEDRNLRLSADVMECKATSETAMPLALFLVEAFTNVFKHAYPLDNRAGAVEVRLERCGGGMLRLSVRDDGAGYAVGDESDSVGATLIKTFARQLDGRVEIASTPGEGTTIAIVFPDPESASGERGPAPADQTGDQAEREQDQEDDEKDLREAR